MFKPKRITSIEYYETQEKIAKQDAEAAPSRDPHSGRDRVAYYQDNGAGEARGVWWTRHSAPSSSSLLLPSSPFGDDGTTVDGRVVRDLALGRDPVTKESFSNRADRSEGRTMGFDITMSAPKSVSLLAAFADEERRAMIFAAHDRAVRKAMDTAFDLGWVLTKESVKDATTGKRVRADKPVEAATAAVYRHFSSRSADGEVLPDPQLHSHVVIMNAVRYEDGHHGAMNDTLLNSNNGALGAMYRAELASILREELGIETVRDGRNFAVAGVQDKIADRFSKRRQEIEKLAREGGFDTASNRRAAEIAALASRAAKDKSVGLTELERAWNAQLEEMGWDRNSLWQSVGSESRMIRAEDKESRGERIQRLVGEAIGSMTLHDAVVEERQILREVVEALQTTCGTDEALAAVDGLKASGKLVLVGELGRQPVYTTREILETERRMLHTAKDRKGERQFVRPEVVERAIRNSTLREDQAMAVRHALNSDGISIVEGSAGAGKSFQLKSVKSVFEECGFKVKATAPSWKATTGLQGDIGLADEDATAIQGLVRRLKSGKETLDAQTVVLLDEAGMVGLNDMAALVEECRKSGAKLILSGDTRQLQPVVAGSPMNAMVRVLGSSRMTEVTRQKADWMKAATMDFADGRADRAMEAYDKVGALTIADTRDGAFEALVADYVESRSKPDAVGQKVKTRAVLTSRNVDVREINDRIRQAGKAAGWIGADDWTMTVVPRAEQKPKEMQFAVGDDVIFGETVELPNLTIRNADLARIKAISGDRSDPTLSLEFAKGPSVTVRLSDLVNYRPEPQEGQEPQPAVPLMQHAAAMTIHASQGVTVDEAYVANVRGMGEQSAYVAMSRHRDSVRMYVDGGRIVENIGYGGLILQAGKDGVALPEGDEDRERLEVTPEQIKRALYQEIKRADRKMNPSDFREIDAFLGIERPEAQVQPAPFVDRRAEVDADLSPAAGMAIAIPGQRRPRPSQPSRVAELAQRMAEREVAPTRYPTPRTKPARIERKGRVTPEEIDQFVRRDLLDFAVNDLGGTLVEKWGNGGAVRFGGAKGEKVGITQKPDGVWNWTLSSGGSGGVIQGLVQHVQGLPYGEALHWLRERFQTWKPSPETLRVERETRPVEREATPETVRVGFAKFPAGKSRWLVQERGIRPEILDRFRADVKADWTGDRASNRHGAVFAHRNPEGDIVNYVRRGAPKPGSAESFRSNAAGGAPTLFMAGDRQPERIYVTESSIDSLSIYQADGAPDRAMLVAPDGTPGRRSLDAMAEIARRNPRAEWHVGLDNDAKGQEFAALVREAVARGNPSATLRDRSPEAQFKDWNGAIRGATAIDEKAAKEARLQAGEAARIQAEQEEARRQRDAEQARNAVHVPRPSGPRF